jgi:NAD-dependent SIR2 family protein deacetylase
LDKISEFHSNINKEKCRNCGKEYLKILEQELQVIHTKEHKTQRKCKIHGELSNSITNFGETFLKKSSLVDFIILLYLIFIYVLVMSWVNPAAQMPDETVKRGGKVIVN